MRSIISNFKKSFRKGRFPFFHIRTWTKTFRLRKWIILQKLPARTDRLALYQVSDNITLDCIWRQSQMPVFDLSPIAVNTP